MSNFIEFMRMFLSYGVLFLIAVGIMIAGAVLGISMRKRKNAEAQSEQTNESAE